jgi:hypothetical protein
MMIFDGFSFRSAAVAADAGEACIGGVGQGRAWIEPATLGLKVRAERLYLTAAS